MSVFWISVLVWVADRVDSISTILGLLALLGFIAVFIVGFIASSIQFERLKKKDEGANFLDLIKGFLLSSKRFVFVLSIMLLFHLIVPSKQAIYMIGAVVAGEEVMATVVDSKEYKKILELFNLSLDKQIKELKELKNEF